MLNYGPVTANHCTMPPTKCLVYFLLLPYYEESETKYPYTGGQNLIQIGQ